MSDHLQALECMHSRTQKEKMKTIKTTSTLSRQENWWQIKYLFEKIFLHRNNQRQSHQTSRKRRRRRRF